MLLPQSDLGLSESRRLRESDQFPRGREPAGTALGFREGDNAGATGTAHLYCLRSEEWFDISQESTRECDRLSRSVHRLRSRTDRTRDLSAHAARVCSSRYSYAAALSCVRRKYPPDAGLRHSSRRAGSQHLRFSDEPARFL